MKKILVTGATGQIGSELVPALRDRYGAENVVAGIHRKEAPKALVSGPVQVVDVTDRESIALAVDQHGVDMIFHLAAILSATGEDEPMLAWQVNVDGLLNVLEVARERQPIRILVPSSIAVFGEGARRVSTPTDALLRPETMYGVTKVTGELLGSYYIRRFGLDVRGLRLPGIISAATPPGGGTTDYAVEIFHEAVRGRRYVCYLRPDTMLPMMYMPDCIRALLSLAEARLTSLKHHCDFNVTGFSVTPALLADEIRKHIQDFEISYAPDSRQAIADSWPNSLDDSAARHEWGWKPDYDLAATTRDMLGKVKRRHDEGRL